MVDNVFKKKAPSGKKVRDISPGNRTIANVELPALMLKQWNEHSTVSQVMYIVFK